MDEEYKLLRVQQLNSTKVQEYQSETKMMEKQKSKDKRMQVVGSPLYAAAGMFSDSQGMKPITQKNRTTDGHSSISTKWVYGPFL